MEIAGYVLHAKLGEGSSGAVYQAFQEVADRFVAIKVPSADGSVDEEMKVMGRLGRQPNIVGVHTDVVVNDRKGIVMEYMTGGSLVEKMFERRMTTTDAVQVGTDMCRALQAVHAAGIVHCDIKPGNIFWHENQYWLGDFGSALLTDDPSGHSAACGTDGYAAPEQARTPSSDVFSLGVTMRHVLFGHSPVSPPDEGAASMPQRVDEPELVSLIDRMTSAVPSDRPSVDDVLTNLVLLESGTGFAPTGPATNKVPSSTDIDPESELGEQKDPVKHRRRLAGSLIGLAVIGLVLTALVWRPSASNANRNSLTANTGALVTAVATTAPTAIPTTAPTPTATPSTPTAASFMDLVVLGEGRHDGPLADHGEVATIAITTERQPSLESDEGFGDRYLIELITESGLAVDQITCPAQGVCDGVLEGRASATTHRIQLSELDEDDGERRIRIDRIAYTVTCRDGAVFDVEILGGRSSADRGGCRDAARFKNFAVPGEYGHSGPVSNMGAVASVAVEIHPRPGDGSRDTRFNVGLITDVSGTDLLSPISCPEVGICEGEMLGDLTSSDHWLRLEEFAVDDSENRIRISRIDYQVVCRDGATFSVVLPAPDNAASPRCEAP